MSDVAIRVENLGKRYRMGQYVGSGAQYKTLRESLTNAVTAPFRRLRNSHSSNPQSAIRHSKSSPFLWALRDVSFEVKRGEVLGIIGKNGAGKSTLLKILTRITEPTEGRVEMHGRVGSLLEVGTGFHPELTGRENVYLSGAILGMARKEIDRKFDEIVDFSGVEKYIDTPVKRYSSGMRVRLGFAVAAHLEPEILLIDEVLAVGDAKFQKKCLGKMSEVAGEGRTVLFVSHNMGAIETLCSRCLSLEDGKISMDGTSHEVVSAYLPKILPTRERMRNLAKAARLSGAGTRLRIEHVEMNMHGKTLRFRDPLEVILKAKSLEKVEDVVFGIGITTTQGVRLLTVESDGDLRLSLNAGQEVAVKTVIPNPSLPPSTYILSVGARSGGELSLDSVPEAMMFEIEPRADEMLVAQRAYLGLRPDADWAMIEPCGSNK